MGVPYLYLNLYKKYRKVKNLVIKNTDLPHNKGYRKLYFDFNSLIHPCANFICQAEINSEDIEAEIINFVISFTKNIIKELTIDYSDVLIFADGLAPFGKIIQQKERRFKSIFLKMQNNEKVKFDSTQISPGTSFMKKLETSLKNDEYLKHCLIDFSKGEAEHKIIKHVKTLQSESEIFIYGLDADLIILSFLTDCNISLIRQKNIVPLHEQNIEFEILNINLLKKAIIEEYKIKQPVNFFENMVFVTFLLGNDFIKKSPFLIMNDLSNILYICSKYNDKIIQPNGNLNKTIFMKILNEINKISKLSINKRTKCINNSEYTTYDWLNNKTPEWIWIYKNDYINYPNKFYKERYYLYYGIKSRDVQKLCNKYLHNLIWNFFYYINNEDVNSYAFYELDCPPLLDDFILNIESINIESKIYKPIINTEEKQLQYILPNQDIISEKKYPNIILDGFDCEWIWETKLI
jgi:5'-3' exonuclease